MAIVMTKKEKAMTKAQAFTALIEMVQGADIEKGDEIVTILQKEIDAMERKNERAKEKAQEKREPIRKAIDEIVAQMEEDVNYTLEDLCGFANVEGLTPMKLRPLLKPWVDSGTLLNLKAQGKSTFVKPSADTKAEMEEAEE